MKRDAYVYKMMCNDMYNFLTNKNPVSLSEIEQFDIPYVYKIALYAFYGYVDKIEMHTPNGLLTETLDNPIHFAALSKHVNNTKIIDVLVNKGYDVDGKNNYNETPLHASIFVNNVKTAKYLIEKYGVNVNIIDEDGHNLLQIIDYVDDVGDIIVLLLENGLNRPNEDLLNLLYSKVIKHNNKKVIDIFKKYDLEPMMWREHILDKIKTYYIFDDSHKLLISNFIIDNEIHEYTDTIDELDEILCKIYRLFKKNKIDKKCENLLYLKYLYLYHDIYENKKMAKKYLRIIYKNKLIDIDYYGFALSHLLYI